MKINDNTLRLLTVTSRFSILVVFVSMFVGSSFAYPVSEAGFIQGGSTKRVNMEIKNAEIQDILRLLAKKHNLNIITSPEVIGKISVSLKNVSIRKALDSIVKMNGFEWFQEENIIMIKSSEQEIRGDRETRVFTLKYVDAELMVTSLEGVITERGLIQTFARGIKGGESDKTGAANILIVTDVPQNIPKIAAVVAILDKPVPQITIEVHFIETTLSEDEDLGIKWTPKVTLGGGPTQSTAGAAGGLGAAGGQSLGFPVFGSWQGLNTATLTFQEFKLVMEFLQTSGNSRLLNNPTLTTLDNHEAKTEVTTVVPVPVPQLQTGGGGGGGGGGQVSLVQTLTFEDKDVSISLTIIPHVTEKRYVQLSITAAVEAIVGFTGPDNDRPITSSRSVDTKIRVKEGETAAIGGLIKEDEIINYKRVPFLHRIPLIGYLFVHKSYELKKSELLIFISPRIQMFEDLTMN